MSSASSTSLRNPRISVSGTPENGYEIHVDKMVVHKLTYYDVVVFLKQQHPNERIKLDCTINDFA